MCVGFQEQSPLPSALKARTETKKKNHSIIEELRISVKRKEYRPLKENKISVNRRGPKVSFRQRLPETECSVTRSLGDSQEGVSEKENQSGCVGSNCGGSRGLQ